jgi:S-adenosylmethionine-diacylgycerolhomoserine-N-methlytransferase
VSAPASETAGASRAEHASFLDRFYGSVHRVYDVTRKYYLFGRDTVLERMLERPWSSLVEVGSGTGRNLGILAERRPTARLGGLDASEVMLGHARKRLPQVPFRYGFAEDADLTAILGEKPERILFSYCLTMVTDPDAALRNARAHLAPGGEIWVVDFGDLTGIPGPLGRTFRRFLHRFHVDPLEPGVLEAHQARIEDGPGRYFRIGTIVNPPVSS